MVLDTDTIAHQSFADTMMLASITYFLAQVPIVANRQAGCVGVRLTQDSDTKAGITLQRQPRADPTAWLAH